MYTCANLRGKLLYGLPRATPRRRPFDGQPDDDDDDECCGVRVFFNIYYTLLLSPPDGRWRTRRPIVIVLSSSRQRRPRYYLPPHFIRRRRTITRANRWARQIRRGRARLTTGRRSGRQVAIDRGRERPRAHVQSLYYMAQLRRRAVPGTCRGVGTGMGTRTRRVFCLFDRGKRPASRHRASVCL